MIQQPYSLKVRVLLHLITILLLLNLNNSLIISDLYPNTLESRNKMSTLPRTSSPKRLGYVDNTRSFKTKPLLGLDYVKIIKNQPLRYQSFFNSVIRRQRSTENNTTSTTCLPLPIPPALKNPPRSVNETSTSSSGILLKEILQEIAFMKAASSGTPDVQCSFNGSWVSEVGGIGMIFEPSENNIIKIHLFETMPPIHGFLNTNWTFEGKAPFKKHGPFLLYGSNDYNSTVAAFTGQCRTCAGLQSIIGAWTVTRLAKNCHDVQIATEHRNDLLHKEALHSFHNSLKINVTGKPPSASTITGNTTKTSGKRGLIKESSWMNP